MAWRSSIARYLLHGLLRPNTLENGVGAHALRQALDALDTFVTALADDVGRSELARVPRTM